MVGVPDERLGEVGKAFVVARARARRSTRTTSSRGARERMANYKVPRSVEVVDALPRNASGKVLKFELRGGALMTVEFDGQKFRQVLGHFPTGVAVVTGLDADGKPAGMAVGSFTSVSLDPPLVAFMPDKSSSSWPKFRDSGSFCVNILGAEQESVCRAFAMKGGDKFAELAWHPGSSGSPILDGVLAWIDCDIDVVHEAGDHFIVIGRVRELDIGTPALPLVFFQGGYGRFSSLSLAAWESDLGVQMRSADLARPHMEALAEELDVECVASAVVGEDMVLVARAGTLRSQRLPTAVGQRIPFEPPMGTAFVAWAADAGARGVVRPARRGRQGRDDRAALETTLADVRDGGLFGRPWLALAQQAAEVLAARAAGPASRRDRAADASADRDAAAGLRVAGRRRRRRPHGQHAGARAAGRRRPRPLGHRRGASYAHRRPAVDGGAAEDGGGRRDEGAREGCQHEQHGFDIGTLLLRIALGITMLAHGYNHAFGGGKLAGTARWFESIGIRPGACTRCSRRSPSSASRRCCSSVCSRRSPRPACSA